jgi:hypothetical protein
MREEMVDLSMEEKNLSTRYLSNVNYYYVIKTKKKNV